ncbi:hypothetical protein [Lactococcus lactis]
MSELENIEHDKQVYTKWLCEDKSKPIRAIHWLWEYLETPHQENNKLTEDDELDILQSFINYKRGSKPQLTIPKSIADMLDFIYDNHFDFNDDVSWVIANIDFLPTDEDYYNFDGWINLSVDNHNLALAYLAGKALGADLVKVGEG